MAQSGFTGGLTGVVSDPAGAVTPTKLGFHREQGVQNFGESATSVSDGVFQPVQSPYLPFSVRREHWHSVDVSPNHGNSDSGATNPVRTEI